MKKRTKALIALLLIGFTVFWYAADVPLRTALKDFGVLPFNITVYNREKMENATMQKNGIRYTIDETIVVKGNILGRSSPALICLQRSKLGHWFLYDAAVDEKNEILWQAHNADKNYSYCLSKYGENAVAPIYFKEGQLSNRISVEIVQDGAQYYICLSADDPTLYSDLDLERILIANGCISLTDSSGTATEV